MEQHLFVYQQGCTVCFWATPLACCLQALAPGDDASCSSTATAEEVSLAAAAQLELAAWQARMPLAALLTDAAMQRRHLLMLLQLMVLTEAGCLTGGMAATAAVQDAGAAASSAISPYNSSSSMMNAGGQLPGAAAAAAADDAGDIAAYCTAADVAAALRHYGLVRCDLYQVQFLRNSAALCTAGSTSDDDSDSTIQGVSLNDDITPSSACRQAELLQQQGQQMGLAASVAELLVWISRSGQSEAVLQRVLEVAKGEQQLAQQVGVVGVTVAAQSA